jgi:ABC-2 type transport system ATP-binding protein
MVKIEHVTKSFKSEVVLDDVSLQLSQGTITGLVGRNGSGKTVLMKLISGLMLADSGTILVKGKQVGKEIDFPASMGLIIETPGFIPYFSAFQNLKSLADIKKTIGDEAIKAAIQRVGLDPNSRKRVGKYSLGMRQRLGIAQAIMEDPELLILDEPFNGLDEEGVKDIRKLLLELKAQGKTILISSHNKEDIEILCDQVYHMERGKLARVE